MPPEFRDTKALILCNDCSGKCTVPYHWLGLKCSICRSYNTVELQILGGDVAVVQAATSREQQPSAATTTAVHQRDNLARPTNITAISAMPLSQPAEPTSIPNRRRHSSHGTELMHHISDRFARSLSPYIGTDAHMGGFGNLDNELESEDEMLGFWNHGQGSNLAPWHQESDSDEDSQMSDVDEEEEEEEEEDELILIGHR
jgi:hypothetical protein